MDNYQKGKVDIVAVAKAAKVSPSTVSRTFNHPNLVSPATRKKINRAVQKLGYIRNRAAQTMHGKRSGTIGLVVPTINHAIFAEVIQAFSETIDRAGFSLLLASHSYDLDREYAMVRKFLEHRVDGVALVGLEHSDATTRLIEQQKTPALAIWNYSEDCPLPCVGADNRLAGHLAAEHLLALGHRHIGLIFPKTTGNDRAQNRLSAVREALNEKGISVPSEHESEAPYSVSQAKQAAMSLLTEHARPTALLCGNDVIAQGGLFAAQSLGLKVPDDLSIIGIGDFKGSADVEPGLTTIRIPAETIGKLAGERFTDYITSDDPEPFRICCELERIVRGTTGPVAVF
ncbi:MULTISPECIES: LacI family DNA-binding transcriptional regulator [unclassified Ruegeria]|uniref:LacI family DNA-binding transcriptional regulator n=1 Tax=unclassified Ruegeria TaxID=2625375 RepID=UPI0014878891|nr:MULTISPECIES: LacI family DNA-binding transcriptional regulator [unclassified Ruegeria]NOD47685.1 substrate-binding domain-containing protein [Ruegeria sp. HKCCD5849]NOD52652.1 substrate-binding domain-containing protein [Ruegeria sp. HKCCD5851]NOD66071.1 substrate-binding domain-containing protein [Ruegeria sp. HKCCD7303]NOE34314.1 substrate-binding domain-containing protein [Ruegeria sp. HKCCD7318]